MRQTGTPKPRDVRKSLRKSTHVGRRVDLILGTTSPRQMLLLFGEAELYNPLKSQRHFDQQARQLRGITSYSQICTEEPSVPCISDRTNYLTPSTFGTLIFYEMVVTCACIMTSLEHITVTFCLFSYHNDSLMCDFEKIKLGVSTVSSWYEKTCPHPFLEGFRYRPLRVICSFDDILRPQV